MVTAGVCSVSCSVCFESQCDKTRRSVADPQNAANVRMFVHGVTRLKASGLYDNLTRQHGANETFLQIHESTIFLPWHRWFVAQMEDAIRLELNAPCFAMPYWDWSADAADPMGSAVWSVVGEANSHGSCLTTGPFAGFRGALDGECLRRDTNVSHAHAHLFTTDELGALVAQNRSFLNFSRTFEDTAHAGPHRLVAQQMASLPSPDDPLFYLHHAFTDVVLQSFLCCHPGERLPLEVGAAVLPYAGGLRAADVIDREILTDYNYTRLCPS